MILKADLHLHSCLSPCGDLSMSPRNIAASLAAQGIRLAALTDHNSALNCPAFEAACQEFDVVPVFGIEAQSREECHILCLFSEPEEALGFGDEIFNLMPAVMNIPEKMGDQVYVDESEDIVGEVDKYLITSADIGLEELAERVILLGGLVIPAHVDRPSFSLTSQLGCIVDGPWSALEVTRMPDRALHRNTLNTRNYPLITSSDAHFLEHIGRRAFDLDIGDDLLCRKDGRVDMQVLKTALSRRPR